MRKQLYDFDLIGLSITALTEHAMSYVKPASEADWNETGTTAERN